MDVKVPKRASDGYENVPTLVGMADVFINKLGHVWNKKARKEPRTTMSCRRYPTLPSTDRQTFKLRDCLAGLHQQLYVPFLDHCASIKTLIQQCSLCWFYLC